MPDQSGGIHCSERRALCARTGAMCHAGYSLNGVAVSAQSSGGRV